MLTLLLLIPCTFEPTAIRAQMIPLPFAFVLRFTRAFMAIARTSLLVLCRVGPSWGFRAVFFLLLQRLKLGQLCCIFLHTHNLKDAPRVFSFSFPSRSQG